MTSALDTYAASFLDPFDGRISQPKIFDGSVTRSSGLRFRQTGNVTLDASGADNYIGFIPGLSNNFMFKKAGDVSWTTNSAFPTHLGTTSLRSNIRRSRLVSAGFKLSLLNSSDDNEGYWEAIRVPVEQLVIEDTTSPVGEDYKLRLPTTYQSALGNFADYNTFQTGRLRDLHRFLFKLNSTAPDHPWIDILPGAAAQGGAVAPNDQKMLYDVNFDMIIIRLVGRIDAVTPTMLQFDCVSNIEIVYADNTVMARLATVNTMVPNMDVLLDRTRFILPAIQIA